MRSILLSLLFIFPLLPFSPAWSETREGEYEYLIHGPFRNNADQLRVTQRILALARNIAQDNGIDVEVANLATETGELKTYPALRILPSSRSPANREAAAMMRDYGGLRLYLSPYDLKRSGAEAFFKPDGSMIGVPADFIHNRLSESYEHEKIHATTYLKLISGKEEAFAGVFKLLKGEQLSERNSKGYTRLSSMDEFLATLFSAKFNCGTLYSVYRNSSGSEFLGKRENENLLSRILFNLEVGQALAAQTQDLLQRAARELTAGNYQLRKTTLQLGSKLRREVYAWTLQVDSYERKITDGRGIYARVPRGSEVLLYSLGNNEAFLFQRLDSAAKTAFALSQRAAAVQKAIGLRLEYADLGSTRMEVLNRACFGISGAGASSF